MFLFAFEIVIQVRIQRLLGIEYDDAKEYFLRAGQTAVIEFVAKANYQGRTVQLASEVRCSAVVIDFNLDLH